MGRWAALGLVFAALGFAASSDEDTLTRNRQRLERLRTDPVVSARLMGDLRAFFALPAERQREVRELDAKLHAGDLGRQARLWGVLERYGAWLDGLPEEDRRQVLDAPTSADRLAVIRFLRDREWVENAAPVIKAEVGKLPEDQRRERIARLRAEEREQRRRWDKSLPRPDGPKPAAFDDLPPDVKAFVLEDLLPAVPGEQFALLGTAEGRWPDYVQAIAGLTRQYVTYRPGPHGPIRGVRDFPPDVRKVWAEKTRTPAFKGLAAKQGWPDFALAFEKACREAKLKPPELGACRPGQYPEATRAFVKEKLADHAAELEKLEGQWPGWPDRVMELAREKGLTVPGMMLPGPAALWEVAPLP